MNLETIHNPTARLAKWLDSRSTELQQWSEKPPTPEEWGYFGAIAVLAILSPLGYSWSQRETYYALSNALNYLNDATLSLIQTSDHHQQLANIKQAAAQSFSNGAIGRLDALELAHQDHSDKATTLRQLARDFHQTAKITETAKSEFILQASVGAIYGVLNLAITADFIASNRKSPKRSTHIVPLVAKTLSTLSNTLTKKPIK